MISPFRPNIACSCSAKVAVPTRHKCASCSANAERHKNGLHQSDEQGHRPDGTGNIASPQHGTEHERHRQDAQKIAADGEQQCKGSVATNGLQQNPNGTHFSDRQSELVSWRLKQFVLAGSAILICRPCGSAVIPELCEKHLPVKIRHML